MVDPKVVEMQMYSKLPHLVVPVVTDPSKVVGALAWVVNEMERRYRWFAEVGVRNFDGFNKRPTKEELAAQARAEEEAKLAEEATSEGLDISQDTAPAADDSTSTTDAFVDTKIEQEPTLSDEDLDRIVDALNNGDVAPEAEPDEPAEIPLDPDFQDSLNFDEPDDGIPDRIPYIVIIVDELADLMQTAPADVEMLIARIAQKARAAGIHLIIATQTPRADVVTGIIKANIPTRIAFQVSSKIDSRVILDHGGAEKLIGKGDMLFMPPGSSKMERSQGAFVSDEEVERIVDFCSNQAEQNFEQSIQEAVENGGGGSPSNGGGSTNDEEDELLHDSIEIIRSEGKASTSMIQRHLRIGYNRAARIMDLLEEQGIVGPANGSKPREVLIPLSED